MPFPEVVNHLPTEIHLTEIFMQKPLQEWRGGRHAVDFMELMDLVVAGQVGEVARFSDAMRSGTDGSQLPLIVAAAAGNTGMVDALLKAGAPATGTANLGMTALHWACGRGCDSIAKTLLLAGGDRAARNWFAYTPVDLASMNGHLKLARNLDPAGARHPATDWMAVTASQLTS